MTRQILAAILITLTVATIAIAAPPSATAPTPDTDATTTVQKSTLDLSLDLDGVFEPRTPDEVRIKLLRYQGDLTIKKAIAPGSKVAKGDLLLQLDTTKIDQQIAAAANDLALAQANLTKAKSDVALGQKADELAMANAEQDLANAQKILKRWDDIDGPAFLLTSSLHVKESDDELQNQSEELDQLHKMYKSEDLTSATADIVVKRAIRALELQKINDNLAHIALDRVQQLEAAIQREGLDSAVSDKTQNVAQLQAAQAQQRVVRDTSLATSQAAAAEAAAKLSDLQNDRESFSIMSTIDGIAVYGSFNHKAWTEIDAFHLAPGEMIQPDQVLITVYTPGQLNLETSWPENQLALFAPGAKVTVTPIAFPDFTYDGKLGSLSPFGQSGPQQSFDSPVDLPAIDPRLAPGFKATVSFDEGKLENILVVPITAVSHGQVWLVKSNQSQAAPVVLGPSDGKQIQIKSGLSEGDVILTTAK